MFHGEEYSYHKRAPLTVHCVLLHIGTTSWGDLVESCVLRIDSCIAKQYASVSIFLSYRVDRKFEISLSSYIIIKFLWIVIYQSFRANF